MPLTLTVLARPSFESGAFDAFLRANSTHWHRTPGATPAEELTEAAGRVCYMSFGVNQSPRTNEQYIDNLIWQGHESVLEHVNWTILMAGVSRAFTHQLVRHRVGFAFSQLSQQYHDEHEALFVSPTALRHAPQAYSAWLRAVEATKEAYAEITAILKAESNTQGGPDRREILRAIRSAARSVLPNATETKIVVTANARAWRHFLSVRGSIVGDEEMRRVSAGLLSILSGDAPSLFSDFRIIYPGDGLPLVERFEPSLSQKRRHEKVGA